MGLSNRLLNVLIAVSVCVLIVAIVSLLVFGTPKKINLEFLLKDDTRSTNDIIICDQGMVRVESSSPLRIDEFVVNGMEPANIMQISPNIFEFVFLELGKYEISAKHSSSLSLMVLPNIATNGHTHIFKEGETVSIEVSFLINVDGSISPNDIGLTSPSGEAVFVNRIDERKFMIELVGVPLGLWSIYLKTGHGISDSYGNLPCSQIFLGKVDIFKSLLSTITQTNDKINRNKEMVFVIKFIYKITNSINTSDLKFELDGMPVKDQGISKINVYGSELNVVINPQKKGLLVIRIPADSVQMYNGSDFISMNEDVLLEVEVLDY